MTSSLLAIILAVVLLAAPGLAWAAPSEDAGSAQTTTVVVNQAQASDSNASSDDADNATDASASADDEGAPAEEAIDDDEVPLAKAKAAGSDILLAVLIGIVAVVVLFVVRFAHINRNMNKMKSRF